jgi:hypothetical protein
MQSQDWIALFELMPEVEHNTLVLTTMSGVDLSVETILRIEPTFLVFRGRVCGQTDDGRVFFLPYHQVDFLQMNRTVKEVEIAELFGDIAEAPESAVLGEGAESAAELTEAVPPASESAADQPASSLSQIAPDSAQGPPTAVRQGAPPRSGVKSPGRSRHGIGSGASVANVPAAALAPQSATGANGAGATTPRNSILERLRAQRNAALPPRPPAR